MFNYEIKEKKEDFMDTVILKSGITGEFTLRAVEAHMEYLRRRIAEIDGQKKVEDAKATNYMSFNPFLSDLTEEQLHAAHLYFEAMAFSKTADEKLAECRKALEEYEEEIGVIYEKLGFVKSDIVAGEAVETEEEEAKADEAA